jgi:hypothetical protein
MNDVERITHKVRADSMHVKKRPSEDRHAWQVNSLVYVRSSRVRPSIRMGSGWRGKFYGVETGNDAWNVITWYGAFRSEITVCGREKKKKFPFSVIGPVVLLTIPRQK